MNLTDSPLTASKPQRPPVVPVTLEPDSTPHGHGAHARSQPATGQTPQDTIPAWGAAITPAAAERLNGTAPTNAMMWVRAKGEGPTQALESAVRQATRGQDLMVNDSAQGRDAFSDALNQIMLLTCLVMGAALIISLTGLANITDVSVLERTREIGVLRATGADRSQIRRLIITETILLAVIGGTLGIIAGTALGAAGSLAVLGNGGLEVAIPWLPLAGLLAIALLVGATASLRPARRAAAMMPITALAAD